MTVNGEAVRVRACGKVNLALRVGGRRADGYHDLATVFQAVNVYDDLTATPAPPGPIAVAVSGPQASLVPTDESNLVVKAARLLQSEYDCADRGASLAIAKQIPVTGGMAGGSADCAAALLALSVLWDLDISPDELSALGARLGADVPFALAGSTALGSGRGDELVPVLSRGAYHWVLAFADVELSTPAVFARFDELHPDAPARVSVHEALFAALAAGDARALASELVNDLQEPALSLCPALARTLDAGIDLGALAGIVSGSGPTLAFLTADEDAAIGLSTGLAQAGVCRAVRRVQGPVHGARLIG